jgi:2-oxoglutarate ferredoxin oxidoreductase subunit alpha
MLDECVGHMTEKVVIPAAEKIDVYPRRHTTKPPEEWLPYQPGEDMIPEMAHAGEGYGFHVTGLTHDEKGYPAMNAPAQQKLVRRLYDKIDKNAAKLEWIEEEQVEGADVVVVSYGITSRVAQRAIEMARERGLKVGKLRLITVWPFPTERIRTIAGQVKAIVVPELNLGQVVIEVERAAAGKTRVIHVPHAGGTVHQPSEILEAIVKGAA